MPASEAHGLLCQVAKAGSSRNYMGTWALCFAWNYGPATGYHGLQGLQEPAGSTGNSIGLTMHTQKRVLGYSLRLSSETGFCDLYSAVDYAGPQGDGILSAAEACIMV